MSRNYRVLVSILNWNNGQRTIECLQSLRSCMYDDKTIVVVDNNSVDNSIDIIRVSFGDIEIIKSSSNLGYAGGHQLALERLFGADYDLIWLLNNDLVVEENTLKKLMDAFTIKPNALYGSVEVGVPKMFWDNGAEKTAVLTGSSILIPAAIIKKYGFMDTSFFMYGEEIDYCLRLRQYGIESIYVEESRVVHESQGSTKNNPRLKKIIDYYLQRNVLRLESKYTPKEKYRKKLRYHVEVYFRAMVKTIGLRRGGKIEFNYYQFLGFLHNLLGIRGRYFNPDDYLS